MGFIGNLFKHLNKDPLKLACFKYLTANTVLLDWSL